MNPATRRLRGALVLSALLGLTVGMAGRLPDGIAPAIAAMACLPLWPLSSLGLPVYARGESWGWSWPNLLGWSVLAVFWTACWWLLLTAGARMRR